MSGFLLDVNRQSKCLCFIVILMLTIFCYFQAIHAGFIWDDDDYVTENVTLKTFSGLSKIWLEPGATIQYYPLVFTSFWIEYQLWGENPLGYHLVNIVLHSLNAFLIWMLLRRLSIESAFIVALIFAVHPVHVETVAWVSERKNLFSVLFYVLSMILCCKFFGVGSAGREGDGQGAVGQYVLSLVFFLCALASKTVACSLPVILLLLIWWKKKNLSFKEVIAIMPFFVFGLVAGFITIWMEKHSAGASGQVWNFSFVERCFIAARSLWFYPSKLIWPQNLNFFYPRWSLDLQDWWHYGFILGTLGVLITLGIQALKGLRGPLVAILFFIVTLFPALGFFDIETMAYSYVADHYQYLASVGIFVLLIQGLQLMSQKIDLKYLYILIITVLGIITFNQCKIYKDKIVLYSDVLKKDPKSFIAYNNRGVAYTQNKQLQLALSDLNQATKIEPGYYQAYLNRANVFLKLGQYRFAENDYNQAIQLGSTDFKIYYNRGVMYLKQSKNMLAIEDNSKVLRSQPMYVKAYNNRGLAYSRLLKYDLALRDFKKAIFLDPQYVSPYINRANLYRQVEQFDKAFKDLDMALSLDSKDSQIYLSRSLVHIEAGQLAEAYKDTLTAQSLGASIDEMYMQNLKKSVEGLNEAN